MNPDFSPKFVKKYANLAHVIGEAASRYRDEVRAGAFPDEEHSFSAEKPAPKPATVAAVTALLVTPTYLAKFDMGDIIGLKAFYAAIIGGFNQTRGALLGGVLVGVLENLTGAYLSPAYKEGVALMLFLVVILFKPEGLLGKAEERKV